MLSVKYLVSLGLLENFPGLLAPLHCQAALIVSRLQSGPQGYFGMFVKRDWIILMNMARRFRSAMTSRAE